MHTVFCREFDSCDTWRTVFGLSCALSLTLNLLTLLLTITVALGVASWMVPALAFFAVSLLFLTLALVAVCWLVFPASVTIGATIFFGVYMVLSAVSITPLLAVAYFVRFGLTVQMEASNLYSGVPSSAAAQQGKGHEGTVLHWAAQHGGWWHRQLLAVLLALGQDVNAAMSSTRWTPLTVASFKGHVLVVKQIIEASADLDAVDLEGLTALHYAACEGKTAVVQVLLEAGADANMRDMEGNTAAMLAQKPDIAGAIRSHVSRQLSDALLEAIWGQDLAAVNDLLRAGAVPDSTDATGTTALMYAANKGFAGGVNALLDKGADPNKGNKFDITPVFHAVWRGHKGVVKKLVKAGAKLGAPNKQGHTVLFMAASEGQVEMIDFILNKGVKLRREDVDAAAINRQKAALWALLTSVMTEQRCTSKLQAAATIGSAVAVKELLNDPNEKAEIDATDEDGNSAIILAAQEGAVEASAVLGRLETRQADFLVVA
jgi:uncharacterized protein